MKYRMLIYILLTIVLDLEIKLSFRRVTNYHHSAEEKISDTKGVIRIYKSKKNRQHNGQMKKDKRTNNELQHISQKIKARATRTPLRPEVNSCAPEG